MLEQNVFYTYQSTLTADILIKQNAWLPKFLKLSFYTSDIWQSWPKLSEANWEHQQIR